MHFHRNLLHHHLRHHLGCWVMNNYLYHLGYQNFLVEGEYYLMRHKR